MVIISNGFNKFHLSVAAAEMERKGWLSLLITGAYPTPFVHNIGTKFQLKKGAKINRLLARGERISDTRVRPLWMSEFVNISRHLPEQLGLHSTSEKLNIFSHQLYGRLAAEAIKSVDSRVRIYHYRAGFGSKSVAAAKRLGMITLCDHSIVHPAMLSYFVNNGGKMPAKGGADPMDRFWSYVLADINQADAVLVNSDFVKNTFLHQGWERDRVHTIYWGVDAQFLKALPSIKRIKYDHASAIRLLFAGLFERRKGAESLIEALQKVNNGPWNFEIIGRVDPEIQRQHASFFKDSRVKCFGFLPRSELAKRMAVAEVFVFPSLAEGSARVVFEALSAGCYVITTPNSGSIVEDDVHGALVPPNDANALANAIQQAIRQRSKLPEIGLKSADLVWSNYQQVHYGEALIRLYERLLEGKISINRMEQSKQ